jgi:hypothetical protein
VDRARLREISKLDFREPGPFLVSLREIEARVAKSNLPTPVRELRTNPLKTWREARQAALFCYGLGQRLGATVSFAREEARDHDFIAQSLVDGVPHVVSVQLKEVVPTELNPNATLYRAVGALAKYADAQELTVAVHLNQRVRFDPAYLAVPKLRIGALWVFGTLTEDQSEWGLWGDFMQEPFGTRFSYPT